MADDLLVAHGRLALRRMRDDAQDYALLAGWLTDPRVLEFYEGRDNPFPIERVRAEYAPRVLAAGRVQPRILLRDGTAIGYVQFYPLEGETLAEYHQVDNGTLIYAIDLFIGEPEKWGRGIGTQALKMTLDYLFMEMKIDKVMIDPHVDNPRAVRSYGKAGFHKVGLMPRHELHEGSWRDCCLMEVTRPE